MTVQQTKHSCIHYLISQKQSRNQQKQFRSNVFMSKQVHLPKIGFILQRWKSVQNVIYTHFAGRPSTGKDYCFVKWDLTWHKGFKKKQHEECLRQVAFFTTVWKLDNLVYNHLQPLCFYSQSLRVHDHSSISVTGGKCFGCVNPLTLKDVHTHPE